MTHENDAVKYTGTDMDFEWYKGDFKSWHESFLEDLLEVGARKMEHEMLTGIPLSGTIEHDGETIAKISDLTFHSNLLWGTGTALHNRIFCTYNNYKSNKKALIL